VQTCRTGAGSVALGNFFCHCSDVDFVAVLEHRPDDAESSGWRACTGLSRTDIRDCISMALTLPGRNLGAAPAARASAPFTDEGSFHLLIEELREPLRGLA
jgi:hypothetical protein